MLVVASTSRTAHTPQAQVLVRNDSPFWCVRCDKVHLLRDGEVVSRGPLYFCSFCRAVVSPGDMFSGAGCPSCGELVKKHS